MTTKSDDYAQRARYDLPSGTYEFIESMPAIAGLSGGQGAVSAVNLAPPRRSGTTYRPAYLGEDEVVLACCHHAHEVAKAHGAREVMLEHLVHALARVAGAAAVLEDRGIHVEALRRETAHVISSEIPVENTTIVAQLRASKDFNTVMYLAAAAASRRDERATSVRDVLDALLSYDPKSRAVRLIRRHATGVEIEEQIDPLREVRSVMERYAGEVRELRLTVSEMRSQHLTQGSSALSLLDDRMRSLEKSVSLLSSEIADDRLNAEDRLKSLQDTLLNQRTDSRAVADRLTSIERAIGTGGAGGLNGQGLQKLAETQRADLTRIEQLVHVGLASIERSMEANKPVTGEAVAGLAAELSRLEQSLETKLLDATKVENALVERLKGFERSIEAQLQNAQRVWSGLTDRITGIERSLSSQREELAGYQRATSQEVKALAATVDAQRSALDAIGTVDGSGLTEQQLATLRQALDGQRRIESVLAERMTAIDTRLSAFTASMTPLQERLAGLERSIAVQRNDVAAINESLDTEIEQIRKALMALSHAQQTLSTAIDEWRQSNSGDLSVISNRLGGLEKAGAAIIATPPMSQVVLNPSPPIAAIAPSVVPVLERAAERVLERAGDRLPDRGNDKTAHDRSGNASQPAGSTGASPPTNNGSVTRNDYAVQAPNLLDRVDRALKNRYSN